MSELLLIFSGKQMNYPLALHSEKALAGFGGCESLLSPDMEGYILRGKHFPGTRGEVTPPPRIRRVGVSVSLCLYFLDTSVSYEPAPEF